MTKRFKGGWANSQQPAARFQPKRHRPNAGADQGAPKGLELTRSDGIVSSLRQADSGLFDQNERRAGGADPLSISLRGRTVSPVF